MLILFIVVIYLHTIILHFTIPIICTYILYSSILLYVTINSMFTHVICGIFITFLKRIIIIVSSFISLTILSENSARDLYNIYVKVE